MVEQKDMAPHAVQRGETPKRRAARPANIRVPSIFKERGEEFDDGYAAQVRRAAGGIWERAKNSGHDFADMVETRLDSDSDDPRRKQRYKNPPQLQQEEHSSPYIPQARPSKNLNQTQLPVASLRPLPAASTRPQLSFPPAIALPQLSNPPLRASAPVQIFPTPAVPSAPPQVTNTPSASKPPPTAGTPVAHPEIPVQRPPEPEERPPPPPVLAPAEPDPPPPPPHKELPTSSPPPPPLPPPPATMTVTAPARTVTLISTMMTTVDAPSPKKSKFPTRSLPPPSVPPMTTGLPPLPPVEPSAPRKGVDSPHTTSTVTATLASAVIPAETIPALPGQAGTGRPNKDDGRPPRMNPEAEHALIAVGSIGSFIFACFLGWILWRTIKRAAGAKRDRESAYRGDTPGLGAKIPFFRKRPVGGGWENLDGRSSDIPPQYEKGHQGTLRLNTDVHGPDGNPINYGPGSVYGGNYMSPADNRGSPLTVSPLTVSPTGTLQMRTNPMHGQGTYPSQVGTYNTQTGTFVSHAPSQSLTHIVGQYGTVPDPGMTLRSGMGAGAYFNQSELARQPSDAYDSNMRQVNRASELSSLSSGFGDGDIVVPGMALQPPPPVQNPYRVSWMSKSNRDTVYTETSEDLPPRFRSVNSWVNQQTGRIKRAQKRPETDDDVPPVPGLPAGTGENGLPPEPQFTMMMPDGEIPRRPDPASTS